MHSKYEVIGIVGEGAYGIVYKCRNKDNGDFVAIKKFKEVEDELVIKTMKRELRVLQMLKHENIVEYKEAFKRKGNLFLVFEYIDKNLLELLQEQPKGLDPSTIKKIIYQSCKAIKYLHDQNIIHRDIKPENLLVDSELKLKLCDFGFARTFKNNKEKLTDYVATRWYRSPELLLTSGYYGPEVDYWAIGCIMGELVDGDPLFPGNNELDQLLVIQKVLGNLPESQIELFYSNPNFKGKKLSDITKPETLERRYLGKMSNKAISFLKGLLQCDPKLRLKDDGIFSHPYFENYPINKSVKIATNFNKQNNNNNTSQLDENIKNTNQPKINPVNISIEKKSNIVPPIISNTTNINIINYNFEGIKAISNHPVNLNNNDNKENDTNSSGNEKILENSIGNLHKNKNTDSNLNVHSKFLNNNFGGNIVLTSYNFNKGTNDNLLSMYSSAVFDKNFKTFYKGDPYNFDIDMNFIKEKAGKKNKEDVLNQKNLKNAKAEEKIKNFLNINPIKKPTLKINENNIIYNPNFYPTEKTPPKAKKKNYGGSLPLKNNNAPGLDEQFKLIQSKYNNFKNNHSNSNIKVNNNLKDFQLPSITNKNILKKLIK